MRPEDQAHVLGGLRKAGSQGLQAHQPPRAVAAARTARSCHLPPGHHRIGSMPQRFRSPPPSAVAIMTRISFGCGAATDTVIVSKWGNDQGSSLCPSGTSRVAPAAATFTFDEITALPPPIAARIGLPSIG